MNFLDLPEDVIGTILSPKYADPVDCTMLSYVCKNLQRRLTGRILHYSLCDGASHQGYLEVLKWADETGHPIRNETISYSLSTGHLAVSKWLYKKGSTDFYYSPRNAIAGGHLDVVKWLHKKGHEFDAWECVAAIKEGQFDILKFLIENGCPRNDTVYTEVIIKNRLDMMQLLLTNNHAHTSDATLCSNAIAGGRFEMLKLLYSHGCDPKKLSVVMAAWRGRLDILEWLYENGCQWDQPAHRAACFGAASIGNDEIVSWLMDHPTPRNQ